MPVRRPESAGAATVTGQQLHHPAGTLARPCYPVWLDQQQAGWSWTSLRVAELTPGSSLDVILDGQEMAVLPLGGALDVETGGVALKLTGRADVFAAVSDWAYLPVGAEARLRSAGGCQVALASARAERVFAAVRVDGRDVAVEVRGAGPATRQVNNFMSPEVFAGADRLMCVEVLTPDGNWSSYPPHKHDESPECPVNNEEIYYFRLGRVGRPGTSAEAVGLHRTYTADGQIDANVVVRDGDVFCIPRGYHGPSVAAPGYPMYYLNVMAGPGGVRSMAFCDDPVHHWVREAWAKQAPDPRCPMTPPARRAP